MRRIRIVRRDKFAPQVWANDHIGEVFDVIDFTPHTRSRAAYWTVDLSPFSWAVVNYGFVDDRLVEEVAE